MYSGYNRYKGIAREVLICTTEQLGIKERRVERVQPYAHKRTTSSREINEERKGGIDQKIREGDLRHGYKAGELALLTPATAW